MELIKKIEILKNSPLFNLSLGSKELFHSNFWEWLSIINPSDTLALFALKKLTYSKEQKIKFEREKNNIDLTISGDNFSIIIENKVKDIPHPQQLEKYWNKFMTDNKNTSKKMVFVLVTLFEPVFPIKNWEIITYQNIADKLANFKIEKLEHKPFIDGYRFMISHLAQLVNSLPNNDSYDFVYQFNIELFKLLNTLKFQDIYIKYRSSRLAYFVYQFLDNKNLGKIIYEAENSEELAVGTIAVNSSFSNGKGIITFEYKLENNIFIGTQIEGTQYRHYFLFRNKLGCKISAEAMREKEIWFNKEFRKKGGGNFCKYEKDREYTFLYQYDEIKKPESFKWIANKIFDDMQFVIKNKKQILKFANQSDI